MSSGLLQVFVELENLHGTSNYVLYWNHGGRLFSAQGTNAYNRYAMCPAGVTVIGVGSLSF